MHLRLKSLTVEAKQWTGKNTDEIEEFVKGKGHTIMMERHPDTDLFVVVAELPMRVQKGDYIAFENTGAVEIIPEIWKERLWEEKN